MFSETVDTVVNRAKRPDRLIDVVNFVNAALRFLHGQHFFADDSQELRIIPHDDPHWHHSGNGHDHQSWQHMPDLGGSQFAQAIPGQPGIVNFHAMAHLQFVGGTPFYRDQKTNRHNVYIWEHPRTFRKLEAVRYDERDYALFKMPSRQMAEFCHYYYRSQHKHVFVGWKRFIDLYFYCFPPYFQYYKPNERPALFNRATGFFEYRNPLGVPGYVPGLALPSMEEQARALVTNWMLERWNELVVAKALEMLYGHLQDPRVDEIRKQVDIILKAMVASEATYPIGN